MSEGRRGKAYRTEVGKVRKQKAEGGKDRSSEGEKVGRCDEVGSGTRRRPIGRDYAAAKDAEVGRNWQRVLRMV
jgi:hypothetical protein